MLAFIYEWIENIAFYLVLMVAVMQMIPQNSYQKYIRFFAGMILILMLSVPILKLFGMTQYHSSEYQKAIKEMEEAVGQMENIMKEESVVGN